MRFGGLTRAVFCAVALAIAPACVPAAVVGQELSARLPPAQTTSPDDSVRALREARNLQSRFERIRARYLPVAKGGNAGECDEIIGRFCVWDTGSDEWRPEPEDEEVTQARLTFLQGLDSLRSVVPGDSWIVGQQVRYWGEAGDWEQARSTASSCRGEGWMCAINLGWALHGLGEIEAAEEAFSYALAEMPADSARVWLDPGPLLDRDGRSWLRDSPDSLAAAEQVWRLSDPFFLVPGNDRKTGHLSRYAYARSARSAKNPHGLRWARDLTEITVRFGWPGGWEKPWRNAMMSNVGSAISHDEPGAVPFSPPTHVLEWASGREEGSFERAQIDSQKDWVRRDRRLPSIHLPPYLDTLGTLESQVGLFYEGRGRHRVLAAFQSDEESRPGTEQELGLTEAGLFLLPIAVHAETKAGSGRSVGSPEGSGRTWSSVADVSGRTTRLSLSAEVAGKALLGLELIRPEQRIGYRQRFAVEVPELAPDILAVSDILLLRVNGAGEESLEGLLAAALPTTRVSPGQEIGAGFQVSGLGYRSEEVSFRVRLRQRDRGWLSRAGGWLGIGDDGEPWGVEWSEPGPESPGPFIRSVALQLPDLDPGLWELIVTVQVPGRSPAETVRLLTVEPGAR